MSERLAYSVGTVVWTNSSLPIYGVVINRDFWLQEAAKKDPRYADYFLKTEGKIGQGMVVPVFFLGDVISSRLLEDNEENIKERYLQKYSYTNTEGNGHIIGGGVAQLLNIIKHIQMFTRGSVKYIESAFHDATVLSIYFNGGYDLSPEGTMPAYSRGLIKLYEKALPGLAGKEYCGT